jgi:hypothetical protein
MVLMPAAAQAKRKAPVKILPVTYDGVRYTAPNDDGRRAYVQAWQVTTNKLIWEVTVFRNIINPLMEEDVQDIYIRQLSFRDGELIVISEDNRAFSVDPKSHHVKRLWKVPAETPPSDKAMPP